MYKVKIALVGGGWIAEQEITQPAYVAACDEAVAGDTAPARRLIEQYLKVINERLERAEILRDGQVMATIK